MESPPRKRRRSVQLDETNIKKEDVDDFFQVKHEVVGTIGAEEEVEEVAELEDAQDDEGDFVEHDYSADEPVESSDNQESYLLPVPLSKDGRPILPRKRLSAAQNRTPRCINYGASKYYDRYKCQEYARRNDFMKYCHVCRKKVVGKLRVLPSDLKMRKVWILRSNLDADRSAELWLKELACEGSHGGEFCEAHFAPGSKNFRACELFPVDRRPPEGQHSVLEDIEFSFESLQLDCVFCGRQEFLNKMIPVIRNRAKRAQWADALSNGDEQIKSRLNTMLKGGVTRFLCDWHMSDDCFEINGFGEWRLLKSKNALPNPNLHESDKGAIRTYLVDKGRDPLFWETEQWRKLEVMAAAGMDETEKQSERQRANPLLLDSMKQRRPPNESESVVEPGEMDTTVCKLEEEDETGPKRRMDAVREMAMAESAQHKSKKIAMAPFTLTSDGATVVAVPPPTQQHPGTYSDESDVENDALAKMEDDPYTERLCQVCARIVHVNASVPFEMTPRTWPFDECRHEKWLEIMDWPAEFEDSMRTLWLKRKNESNLNGDSYHFCPINVCQSHLDYRDLSAQVEDWLSAYCVVCDVSLKSPNLLLPFPIQQKERQKWVDNLLPTTRSSKTRAKKWNWLRERLTRLKPTKYRICVFHFSKDSFIERENRFLFSPDAVPLPLTQEDFVTVPRGPNAVSKCLMCDDWKKQAEMRELRWPTTEGEKAFLTESIVGADRVVVRRAIDILCTLQREILICVNHFPDQQDPFELIAERRLMFGVTAECLLCSNFEDTTNMIAVPSDRRTRTRWVNAMCREPWVLHYIQMRLAVTGRHFLCATHFHRNALRYVTGVGLYKRSSYVPLLACQSDEERDLVLGIIKTGAPYQPIVLETVDDDGVQPLTYETALNFLGEDRMLEVESELRALEGYVVEPHEQLELSEKLRRRVQRVEARAERDLEEVIRAAGPMIIYRHGQQHVVQGHMCVDEQLAEESMAETYEPRADDGDVDVGQEELVEDVGVQRFM